MTPPQKPHRSRQDYATPPEFITAVKAFLGIGQFAIDLAASDENAKALAYFSEADDSLTQDWTKALSDLQGDTPLADRDLAWAWLNPPYANIGAWVEKARAEAAKGAAIAMLLPASVSTEWYAAHVHGRADVVFIRPRLTFVGHADPYPKDLMLLLYSPEAEGVTSTWNWKTGTLA